MLRTALFLLGLGLTAAPVMGQVGQETTPDYHIHAIRYATLPDFPLAGLMPGAPRGERLDIPMIFWVIQGGGRTILLDTGFHRPPWADDYGVTDFMAADEAVGLLGLEPGDVTDIIVSHAHWDHMGGIDLFPDATIWIQEEEFRYYTGPAWQESGRHGGIDPADVLELVRRNTAGKVRLIPGDDVEILPGIRVYTGARHTFASQYVRVDGDPPILLASDNAYLFRNLEEGRPIATFDPADSTANKDALARMIELVGGIEHIVPGHDPEEFQRFPTQGRVATIR
ncbi:MAG: N-acyl homoserine lactonase family protein [Gemmatimonadota bacterium]